MDPAGRSGLPPNMNPYGVCPRSEEEWKHEDRRVVTGGIHDFARSVSSTSRFGLRQYLALKVIWNEESITGLLSDQWLSRLGARIQGFADVRLDLHADPAFRIYLTNLDMESRRTRALTGMRAELGPFATVLQNQRVVSQLAENSDYEHKLTGLSGLVPRTGKAGSTCRSSVASGLLLGGSPAGSADSTTVSAEDHILFDSPHTQRVEEASTACEQVVKNAALSLLQAIFATSLFNAYWSAQPKNYRFGRTGLNVSVDGHLHLLRTSKSAALLNVSSHKRRSREKADFRTEWLESAQMALWIEEEPHSFWRSGPYGNICRRVLVSQNHTEIYIIVAEYEESYMQYLKNKTPMKKSGFLYMHRFGPYSTTASKDVDLLTCQLKALLMQATIFPAIDRRLPFQVAPLLADQAAVVSAQGSVNGQWGTGPTSVAQSNIRPGPRAHSRTPEDALAVLRSPSRTDPSGSSLQFSMSPPLRLTKDMSSPDLFPVMESRIQPPKPQRSLPPLKSLPQQSSAPATTMAAALGPLPSIALTRASSTSESVPVSVARDNNRPSAPRDIPAATCRPIRQVDGTGTRPATGQLHWKPTAESDQDGQAWSQIEFGESLSPASRTPSETSPPRRSPSGRSPSGKPPLAPRSPDHRSRNVSPRSRSPAAPAALGSLSPTRVALLTSDRFRELRRGRDEAKSAMEKSAQEASAQKFKSSQQKLGGGLSSRGGN